MSEETEIEVKQDYKLANVEGQQVIVNSANIVEGSLSEIMSERDALQESEKLLMMLINDAYKSATGTPSKKTTLEMMRYVANRPKLQQLVSNGDSKEIKKYRSCEKLEGEG